MLWQKGGDRGFGFQHGQRDQWVQGKNGDEQEYEQDVDEFGTEDLQIGADDARQHAEDKAQGNHSPGQFGADDAGRRQWHGFAIQPEAQAGGIVEQFVGHEQRGGELQEHSHAAAAAIRQQMSDADGIADAENGGY